MLEATAVDWGALQKADLEHICNPELSDFQVGSCHHRLTFESHGREELEASG